MGEKLLVPFILVFVGIWYIDFYSMLDIKGCDKSWLAVILFVGSHLRHSDMKSKASLGQSGNAEFNEIYVYYGKFMPFLAACLYPYGQFCIVGDPITEHILLIWSI